MDSTFYSNEEFERTQENPVPHRKTLWKILGVIIFLTFFYYLFLSAPRGFPVGTMFRVEHGSSLRGVSFLLKQNNIIRSRLVFEAFVIFFGHNEQVIEADYYLEDRLSASELARRISKGETHIAPIAVTIPEGFDNSEIADAFVSKLKNFNRAAFLLMAKNSQGYLFPDTYFFDKDGDEKDVFSAMRENFKKKIKTVLPDITTSGKTEKDIVKMASIVEGEAKGEADRPVISGILWKRIKIGMALQADSAPETYKTRGLPKSPIGNPGMAAIVAAIHPESSPYLYYLHDKKGVIHYARTFSEHLDNIDRYLR